MIKNYFKVAWRNMMKNKIFSFINVFGLSAGLVCCMMTTLYIFHEISYDRYHLNADNIYQVATIFRQQGEEIKMPNTPAPMGQAMQRDFPEVIMATRLLALFNEDKTLIQYSGKSVAPKSFYETKGFLADSTFFRMFTYNFIEGNPSIALNNPKTTPAAAAVSGLQAQRLARAGWALFELTP